MLKLATAGREPSNSEALASHRLWSLWDTMQQFHAGTCSRSFAIAMQRAQVASTSNPTDLVPNDWVVDARMILMTMGSTARILRLVETEAYIQRLERDFESPVQSKELHYGLHHLMGLMQSELEKREVFAIEQEKTKYFRDEKYGVTPPSTQPVAFGIFATVEKPKPLFSERSEKAFPSAYMDIVEAGRCLALSRNNGAVYHLMQVAEVGLRALAWDRRVIILRHKGKTVVPLDYAQWGEIIGELEKKKAEINHWKRGKALKEDAIQYYSSLIFEVSSFNEIYRKHISHARGKLYQDDTIISCWGHVYRFMDNLADRISEAVRTPKVWKATT